MARAGATGTDHEISAVIRLSVKFCARVGPWWLRKPAVGEIKMKSLLKAAMFAGAALSAVPAFAVAQEATDGAAVQEIVVTARRREQTLKDVPVAVTAVTGEQLERQGAVDITNLQQSTPNLTVQIA